MCEVSDLAVPSHNEGCKSPLSSQGYHSISMKHMSWKRCKELTVRE